MKILQILASVDPRGGGPMESVYQCTNRMLSLGHKVEVLTLDGPDAPFLAEFGLPVHALGPSRGNYLLNKRLLPWLRAHAARFDAVIVNGIWTYHSFGVWRALRTMRVPYFVYPHGMLDPWFKRRYPLKHLKKWLYWPWAEYRVLRDASAVLFTCEDERVLARDSFWLYRVKERVVSFGTGKPVIEDAETLRRRFLAAYPQLYGRRLVLFLGRIHPKKGCDLLIEAFSKVAGTDPDLQLVLAGPDQVGWIPELEARIKALGISDRVSWLGMVRGDAKWGAFYASHVFVLPSHQENFGIAVAEALGCGLPVIVSDKVNIWREIETDGAGLVGPDTVEATERNLRQFLSMSGDDYAQMKQCALGSFDRRFTVDAMADSLIDVVREHVPAT